ncbi:NAD(P)-dependent dehydrogenase (short-subunit alcohol dehydrogenase family) [Kribbella antiqua]|uniref:NAD(P)-dependent dehydrogenase (Short-subunit alcohol dehydrogenase family) n=1 Tax=Kribbella antiqua TaxID=2512217 RepID=A0A4R2IJD3_9ACTN|nr:SDR family oxidoreductase [Kribbella antiqua]TCO45054.1 NAD(P)-dependent dehydrogenase (short-subunit alcohol dehydrogenase family) [Kribbella antiqua]
MLLENKTAIVYGGGGAMGGAVARAFAAEGATVHLAGRTLAKLEKVAADIAEAGGRATVAVVDGYDAESVNAHVASIEGRIDVVFNGVSVRVKQSIPLVDMAVDDFVRPVEDAARTNFITATAAARRMIEQRGGVILMLSSSASRESGPDFEMGGFSLACASIETLTRSLAGEIGQYGVRVVALRPNFTPDTHPEWNIEEGGLDHLINRTALRRLPRMAEVAHTAAFAASDHAGPITAAVLNLSCGAIAD